MALNHTVQGSVNYTVVGSPTIVDGVVSGFSTNDYLTLNGSYTESDLKNNFELFITFTTTGQSSLFAGLASWSGSPLVLINASKKIFLLGAGFTNKTFSTILADNIVYSFRLKTNNGNITADILNSSGTVIETYTTTFTDATISKQDSIRFGKSADGAWDNCSIDLNQTYIKINGEAWFGNCPVEVKKVVRQANYPAEVSGVDSLSLPNAKANSLTEVKLSGGCEQSGTPTPTQPIDIVCNNGVVKVSKNLFNKNAMTQGYIYNAQLEYVTSDTGSLSDYIPVVAGQSYTFTGHKEMVGSFNIRVNYFDANKEIQSQDVQAVGQGDYNFTITIPSGIKYLRYSFRTEMADSQQLELGSTATPYMPYGQIYTDGTQEVVTDSLGNTANAERLLEVGNYKDTQEILSGAITRNIGIKVLNGTEDTTALDNYSYGTNSFAIKGNPIDGAISSSAILTFCTHFKSVSFDSRTTASGQICYIDTPTGTGSTKTIVLRNTEFTSLANFKTFLQEQYQSGNPLIIVFPTPTATTETVTAQTLNVQAGNNTLSVTQASMSGLELSAKYTQTARDVNYVIKDDKLVFADSGLYLAGPNTYTKVGSPTIVDGVANGFSASNHLTTPTFPSDMNKLEVKFVATINNVVSHFQAIYYSNSLAAEVRSDGRAIRIRYLNSGGTVSFIGYTANDFQYDVPIEIYATWENSYLTIVTKQAGVQLSTNTVEAQKPSNNLRIGTDTGSSNFTDGSVDLNNTYVKVNDQLWFYGKNYASQNIAPVPSGYTYGTTTTSAIGWVDMRTQAFTAAPSGATIGRDE